MLTGIPEDSEQLPLLWLEVLEHFHNDNFIRASLEWKSLSLKVCRDQQLPWQRHIWKHLPHR